MSETDFKHGTLVLGGESQSEYPCPFQSYGCPGTLKRIKSDEHGTPIKNQIVCTGCFNLWLSTAPDKCSQQKPTEHELSGWVKKHPHLASTTNKGRKILERLPTKL